MDLRVETITTQFNTPPTLFQSSGGAFEMQVPQSSFMMVRPVSYEFRVIEKINEQGLVEKVNLQTRVWEHTNYGNSTMIQDWTDVPRVKVPYVATVG